MQPFAVAPLSEHKRLRDRSLALGDVVKRHRSDPDIWLVSSATHSTDHVRVYYRVNVARVTCGCEGYRYHGICRHLCRVSWELHRAASGAEKSA